MSIQSMCISAVREIAAECGIDIVQSATLPIRGAAFGSIPTRLHPAAVARLERDYPKGLFAHQALALEALLDGKDVALSTNTASGKSLVFITAAIDILTKQRDAKVLALYPAKALIRDQISKWEYALAGTGFSVQPIDGTVPTEARGALLDKSHVVLMTPDVAHAWMMANPRDRHIARFRNALKLLILDEAHVYEGVFGTNMAYLLRRLDAVTRGARVLCSTATLGRPSDYIYQLTGRVVLPIGQEMDGSPAPERHILVATDPGYDKLVELLKRLASVEGGRFLAFSDSRKMVEQIVAATMRNELPLPQDKYLRSEADPGLEEDGFGMEHTAVQRILPFRAGYEAEDAKKIQDALYRGQLGGVVSTSAMELGLDIGEIDLVVLLGLPPSLKAFRQRLGRAGRRRDGICLLIDGKGVVSGVSDGLQKYLEKPMEPSWLYLENKYLQYANVLCTAVECSEIGSSADQAPFNSLPAGFARLLENELNPTEVIPGDLYPLKQRAQAGPHREFPLRSGIEKTFRIDTAQGLNLGTVSFSQMMREAYPGAIYHYMARPYRVVQIDLRDGHISARPERHWTTKPLANTMVFPRFSGGLISLYGESPTFLVQSELQVSERVSGFQEIRGGNKLEPHRYGAASGFCRRELTRFFETSGVCWFTEDRTGLSEEVGIHLLRAFSIDFGVQERDLGLGLFHAARDPFDRDGKVQGLCIYDAVNGSLRLTQRLAENFLQVVTSARQYCETEGSTEVALQLEKLGSVLAGLHEIPLNQGQRFAPLSNSGNWVQVVCDRENAMYFSEDGAREVTVTGYRFTPIGLMYELVPENDQMPGRWMVAERALQPIYGMTKMKWVHLITGEEQDDAPKG